MKRDGRKAVPSIFNKGIIKDNHYSNKPSSNETSSNETSSKTFIRITIAEHNQYQVIRVK